MSSNSPTLQLAQTDTQYLRMGLILALYTVVLCLHIMQLSLIRFDWFRNWTHKNFGVWLVRLPTQSTDWVQYPKWSMGVACHKLTYSHIYAYLYTVLPLTLIFLKLTTNIWGTKSSITAIGHLFSFMNSHPLWTTHYQSKWQMVMKYNKNLMLLFSGLHKTQ